MKAIVLTVDKYHPLADHMIAAYDRLWPYHPFTFRIPYQVEPAWLSEKYGAKVELIQTDRAFAATVLSLLEGIADDEWVYWCIDDKYPVELDLPVVQQITRYVEGLTDPAIAGIMFCRPLVLYRGDHVEWRRGLTDIDGRGYVRRKDYAGIWGHQFVRARVLRWFFGHLPARPFSAKEMDRLKWGIPMPDEMFVLERSAIIFGESTTRGKLTQNCAESLARHGLPIPAGFEIAERSRTIGHESFRASELELRWLVAKQWSRGLWRQIASRRKREPASVVGSPADPMQRAIHLFDNGVKVYDDHLIDKQRERYKKRNVHEAEEEDIFVQLIKSLPANGCFIDLGAAIGYYPILAKKLSPTLEVHAAEPLERHRKYFVENINLNGYLADDFRILSEAVSSKNGRESFVQSGYTSKLKQELTGMELVRDTVKRNARKLLARVGLATVRTKKVVDIETITLDKLTDGIGKKVNLLQMDVQGAELGILQSGSRTLQQGVVETFLIGTHGADIHRGCREILKANGYAIEHDHGDTTEQPDGILVASKGVRRLG